jgi:hypothetical protein
MGLRFPNEIDFLNFCVDSLLPDFALRLTRLRKAVTAFRRSSSVRDEFETYE